MKPFNTVLLSLEQSENNHQSSRGMQYALALVTTNRITEDQLLCYIWNNELKVKLKQQATLTMHLIWAWDHIMRFLHANFSVVFSKNILLINWYWRIFCPGLCSTHAYIKYTTIETKRTYFLMLIIVTTTKESRFERITCWKVQFRASEYFVGVTRDGGRDLIRLVTPFGGSEVTAGTARRKFCITSPGGQQHVTRHHSLIVTDQGSTS